MSEKTHTPGEPLSQRDELDALMPWFVAGTLSPKERARVEAALVADPALQASRAAAEAEFEAVLADNDARAVPGHDAVDKLMARIDEAGPMRGRSTTASLIERLGQLLQGLAPRTLVFAGAGLALLALVEAGILASTLVGPGGQAYQVASGPGVPAPGEGSFVIVQFVDTATSGAIAAYLRDIDAEIVAGPAAGGLYHLRIAAKPLSAAERDTKIKALAQRKDLVRSVAPTP